MSESPKGDFRQAEEEGSLTGSDVDDCCQKIKRSNVFRPNVAPLQKIEVSCRVYNGISAARKAYHLGEGETTMVYHDITTMAVMTRVLTSVFIGGMLGLERGMKNRPAGLRTYMLVSVGACLIMMTNQYIYQFTGAGDPMRLGAQVVSGIGFLGAGTIVVTRHNQIKGLTTAAGLWASAGVGLALGIGFYEGAIAAGISVFAILTVLQRFENSVHRKIRVLELYVELDFAISVARFAQDLKTLDLKMESIQFEPDGGFEADTRAVVLTLKARKATDHKILRERIRRIEGVVHLEEL